MIGTILDAPVDERIFGGVAMATLAAWWGAAIIRTHDVKATVDALKICGALRGNAII
jgi:dihydropteroate synthase